MEEILKELTNLQETIAESKSNVAKFQGRKEEILNSLKKEFNVKTITEAEKKLSSLEDSQTKLEKEIQGAFDKLKEEYEW